MVQRLPVRIALDPQELTAHPLRVGLSMKADIDVSEPTSGHVRGRRASPRPTPTAARR